MARKSKFNAGVIGLGIIGSRIAANLRTAGFQVYVWNRTPKPAPNFLASPAEVAGVCEVIQLVVADAVALFEVINAMGAALTPKHTVICSATVGQEATLEAERMVREYGARFLDAPFTGSKESAEKAQLVYYIGGDDDTFKRAEPVLKATSKAIVRIGPVGHAATVKIATNMIAAAIVQTTVEACAIVQRSGVDLNALAKALEHHGTRSALLDQKLPKIIARDYETHFSVKHMFKDVQLAIQAANNSDIDIPATTATAGVLYASINHGMADLDYCAIARFYEIPEPVPEPAAEPAAVEAAPEPPAGTEAGAEEPPVKEDAPPKAETADQPPVAEKKEEEETLPAANPETSSGGVSDAVEVSQPETAAAKTPEPATATATATVAADKGRTPLPPVKKEKSKGWFGSRRRE